MKQDTSGRNFRSIMDSLSDMGPPKGAISEQQFLDTELANGISLDNPGFLQLGQATAAQMREYPDIRTVLDFGAGVGAYSQGFHREGFDIYAYEHFAVHRAYIRERLPHLRIVDQPFTTDLLAWIETAEHMTDAEIDRLLNLVKPSYILFSSTSERTENDLMWGHINIKEQEQWVRHLAGYGYAHIRDMPFPTQWTKLFRKVEAGPMQTAAPRDDRKLPPTKSAEERFDAFGEAWLGRLHQASPLAASGFADFRSALRNLLEGKPSALYFDESLYLSWHPDVQAAVQNGQFLCGYEHYLRHGRQEGRVWTNGTVIRSADRTLPQDFDWRVYLLLNIGLLEGPIRSEPDAVSHYLNHGARERRPCWIHQTEQVGGVEKTIPLFLFYHVYCDNEWQEIFREQMGLIISTGLYDQLDRLYINLVGTAEDLRFVEQQVPEDRRILSRVDIGFEFSTLDIVLDESRKGPFKGLYLHTKGASYPAGGWRKAVSDFWRRLMNHHVLQHWRDCHRLVHQYDLVGSLFRPGNTPTDRYWQLHAETHIPENMKFTDHFSGNFFWFDARYFAGIEGPTPAQRLVRFNAEWLPFKNHPYKCEVFFDLDMWKDRLLEFIRDWDGQRP
jgi:hypothetical protein